MSTIAESIAEYQSEQKKSKKRQTKKTKKPAKKKSPQNQPKKPFTPLFVQKTSLDDVPQDMTIDGMKIIRTKGLEKQTYIYKKTGTDVSQERLQQTLGYWDRVMEWLLDYGEQHPDFQIAFDTFLVTLPK